MDRALPSSSWPPSAAMMDGTVSLMGGTMEMRLRSGRLIESNMPRGTLPEFVRSKQIQRTPFDGTVNVGSSQGRALNTVPEAIIARAGRSKDPDSSDDDASTASEPKPHWAPQIRRRCVPGKAAPSTSRSRAVPGKKPVATAAPLRGAVLLGVPMKRSNSSGSASGKGVLTATAKGVLQGLGVPMRRSRSHSSEVAKELLEPLPLQRSGLSDLAGLQLDLA